MKIRVPVFLMLFAAVSLLGVSVLAPARAEAAQAAPTANALTIPLGTNGTLTGPLGTLTNAALNITNFQSVNGVLQAVGTITGNFTPTGGTGSTPVSIPVVAPVTGTGTCQILTLDIGAIHLDLLGLVVDLAPIHLNVTAQSGPGNLLGNLLCAVAHLLDGGNTNAVAAILNALLSNLNLTL